MVDKKKETEEFPDESEENDDESDEFLDDEFEEGDLEKS
jgi:hypothetical protein